MRNLWLRRRREGKGRRGRAPILSKTRNLGRYAPKFLAPAEGWWPSATDWQGLNFFTLEMTILFVFPCSSSWCTLFFLSKHFSWRKSWNKIVCFDFFEKKPKKGDFVSQVSPWKMHWQKKQSTPRRRAWKNKEGGSLHFSTDPQKVV